MTPEQNSYYELIEIPVEPIKIPLFIEFSINQCGWERHQRHDRIRKITARLKDDTTAYGVSFRQSFGLRVEWEPHPANDLHTAMLVRVTNKKRSDSRVCRDMVLELTHAIQNDAAQFLVAPDPYIDPRAYPVHNFAGTAELQSAGYCGNNNEDKIRFYLGYHAETNEPLALPYNEVQKHVLVCGPTGTGKTTGCFIPNLLENLQASVIATEITAGNEAPHLYSRTAGYRAAKANQQIYYFNPTDPAHSYRLNPLDQIDIAGRPDDDKYDPVQHVVHVCQLILLTTQSRDLMNNDQYWEDGQRLLLTALVFHSLSERNNKNAHLGYIVELLTLPEEKLKAILCGSPILKAREHASAFFGSSDEDKKTRQIMRTALVQRLLAWAIPSIADITAETTIPVKSLRDQLFTFYFVIPVTHRELNPIAVLVFHWLLDLVSNETFKHPLMLMLDEFTNLGWIEGMDRKLTTLRHKPIPMLIGVQDRIQLELTYGKQSELFKTQPSTRIFFRPNSLYTAKEISEALGTTTVAVQRPNGSTDLVKTSLAPPEKLMRLLDGEAIAFLPRTNPVQLRTFHWKQYLDKTGIAPPPLPKYKVKSNALVILSADTALPEADVSTSELSVELSGIRENIQTFWDRAADCRAKAITLTNKANDLQESADKRQAYDLKKQARKLRDEARYFSDEAAKLATELQDARARGSEGSEPAESDTPSLLQEMQNQLIELNEMFIASHENALELYTEGRTAEATESLTLAQEAAAFISQLHTEMISSMTDDTTSSSASRRSAQPDKSSSDRQPGKSTKPDLWADRDEIINKSQQQDKSPDK